MDYHIYSFQQICERIVTLIYHLRNLEITKVKNQPPVTQLVGGRARMTVQVCWQQMSLLCRAPINHLSPGLLEELSVSASCLVLFFNPLPF